MKKLLEKECELFFEMWGVKETIEFLENVMPLFEIFDVSDHNKWMTDMENEENRNVMILRTIYVISKISELHAGKLCKIKYNFKDLYIRMEKKAKEIESMRFPSSSP